jgi:hypothetical protein
MWHLMRFPFFVHLAGAVVSLLAASSAAHALTYRLAEARLAGCKGECAKFIVATGTLGQTEHLKLLEFLDEAFKDSRVARVLIIDSPGGFTGGGLYLGFAARQLKITMIVGSWSGEPITHESGLGPGTCASACTFALAGGTERYFVTGSRIGVHRQHRGAQVLDPTTRQPLNGTIDYDAGYALYRKFFSAMGIDSAGVVAKLAATPSESMYWFSPAELGKLRIARDLSKRGAGRVRR